MAISLDKHLNNLPTYDMEMRRHENSLGFRAFLTGVVVPLLAVTGILLATIYLSCNCSGSGTLHPALLGTYITLGTASALTSLVYFIALGVKRSDNARYEAWDLAKIKLLTQMQQKEDFTTFSKESIEAKKRELEEKCEFRDTARLNRKARYYAEPLLLLVATVVATLFASQLISQSTFSSTFYNGTCSLVGIGGAALVIGSLIRARLRSNAARDFSESFKYRKSKETSLEFEKRVQALELKDWHKMCVYNWLVPLILVLAVNIFGSLCVHEWASHSLQPYLFTATISGGTIAATLAPICICLTLKSHQQIEQEARGISPLPKPPSPPPVPPVVIDVSKEANLTETPTKASV